MFPWFWYTTAVQLPLAPGGERAGQRNVRVGLDRAAATPWGEKVSAHNFNGRFSPVGEHGAAAAPAGNCVQARTVADVVVATILERHRRDNLTVPAGPATRIIECTVPETDLGRELEERPSERRES